MSSLASITQGSPGSYFFTLAGGGGAGTTLQSPAVVNPAANGTAVLDVIPGAGSIGSITVGGVAVNQTGVINIENGNYGYSRLGLGNGNTTGCDLVVDSLSTILQFNDPAVGNTYMSVDTALNNIVLGASSAIVGIAQGTVTANQAFLVRDAASGANAVGITPTSATASVISQTVGANGTLNLGSSIAAPDTLALSDLGSNAGYALLGGNGGENIYMIGGNAGATVVPNIRTDALNSGTLTLGSSQTNALTMFVRDDVVANTGYVDITGGVSSSIALRLQGANNTAGANNAYVSTNYPTGNTSAQLNLSSAFNDVPAAVQITSAAVKINRPITGNTVIQTLSIAALGDGASAQIPGSGSPGITEGLWAILANNVNQDTATGTQVSCVGYFSDAVSPGEWIIGGCGFGQALTNPTRNFSIQPTTGYQTLTYLNTSGFNMAGPVKVYFIRISGALGV